MMRFKFPLYVTVVIDWYFLFWTVNYMVTNDLSLFKIIGCIFIAGLTSASNINVSHELIHKEHNEFDSLLG
jgi:hypothetical protein